MKIPNQDRCRHCGGSTNDVVLGIRIVSEDRYKWLVEAAEEMNTFLDLEYGDWKKKHKELLKRGE